ncbi:hypothetical protein [Tenacibaculum agarivorans]|uniref:hypothetical protein n=1 Tax=Tenacibaculum agarivorans TaxID=1908389 RepID=UPI00094B7FF7|nr:hypothetical protein [Tenacibaculum agarivorans]
MKTIIITLFFSIITNYITAQATDNLDNETLFVLFEKSESTNKSYVLSKNKKHKEIKNYLYFYTDYNSEIKFFTFDCSAYFSLDDQINNTNPAKRFSIHKSFLENNFIIDNSYIDKVGFDTVFEMLFKSKTIFVIDKSEIKGDKITLREAKLDYPPEE